MQGIAQRHQVGRQGRAKTQYFLALGMFETEHMGVQRLPSERRERGTGALGQADGLGLEARAVGVVTEQWMTRMGEVYPNLVGAPGLKPAGQKAGHRLAITPLICSKISQWVTASRPSWRIAWLSRAWGWRPIGASIVPLGRSGMPQTNARYSRSRSPVRP